MPRLTRVGLNKRIGKASAIANAVAYAILAPASDYTLSSATTKGSLTPTFTRATTATFTDYEGVVRTAKSGELRWGGARRVENQVLGSSDISDTTNYWTVQNGASVSGSTLTMAASSNSKLITKASARATSAVGNTWVFSVELRNATTSSGTVTIGVQDAGGGFPTTSAVIDASGSDWVRATVSRTHTDAAATTITVIVENVSAEAGTVEVRNPQLENTTGQSDTTTPGEYVATTTAAASKYFYTTNGNTVASNVVTEADGDPLRPTVTTDGAKRFASYADRANSEVVEVGSRRLPVCAAGGTNLIPAPEALDSAEWALTNATVTANSIVAPDGTATADKLVEDSTASVDHYISESVGSLTASANYTASLYAKAGERTKIKITVANGGNGADGQFNLSTGAVDASSSIGTGTLVGATITNVGGGWYRCAVTVNSSNTTYNIGVRLYDGASYIYNGDGTSGVYLWGAKLEQASAATRYVPASELAARGTLASPNGRYYEVAGIVPGANLYSSPEAMHTSPWASQQCTFTADATTAPDGTATAESAIENTANNKHYIQYLGNQGTCALPITYSFFAKANGRNYAAAELWETAIYGNRVEGRFDLATGVASAQTQGAASGASARITSMGDGWYRCELTGTVNSASSALVAQQTFIQSTYSYPAAYTGDGVSGIYVWGAKLEQNTAATPYVSVAGTTLGTTAPTSTVEPVWSRNISAGELVTNGSFDTDTGWTKGANASIAGGVLSWSGAQSGNETTWQDIGAVIGKAYVVTFTISDYVAGTVTPQVDSTGAGTARSANGTYTQVIAAAGSGNGRFTFFANSTFQASIDNVSVREVAAYDNGVAWECKGRYTVNGALIEEARTNSLLRSRNFTASPWAVSGTPVTAIDQVGVDGIPNKASSLQDDSATGQEYYAQSITVPADTNTHVASVFVKKDTNEARFPAFLVRLLTGGTDTYTYIVFNTKTGETKAGAAAGGGLASFGAIDAGDWWRIYGVITNTNNTTCELRIIPALTDDFSAPAVPKVAATGTIVADAAMLELNKSYPSSFVETTTVAVTRNADDLTYPEPAWFDTAGTVVVDQIQADETRIYGDIIHAGGINRYLYYGSGPVIQSWDGTSMVTAENPASYPSRVGVKWSASARQGASNGTAGTAGAYDGNWNGTTLSIGSGSGSNGWLNGHLHSILLYNRDVGATKLAALTARDAL